MEKRGTILLENIIFIVLNIIFITILILFIVSKTGSAAVLEEKYAKQIALTLDSANPTSEIRLDLSQAIKRADKEHFPKEQIVTIRNNLVTVRLKEGSGYSYSFFKTFNLNYNITENQLFLFIDHEKQKSTG